MIIGIDLDNTLVRTSKCVSKLAAKNLKIKSYPKEHDYWYTGWPEDLKTEIFRLYNDPMFMGTVTPYAGVAEKLKRWKKDGHKIIIITARNEDVRPMTIKLISTYFPLVDDTVFGTMGKTKEKLFKDTKIEVWIDDNPLDVVISNDMGIKTYLITNSDTPYNRHIQNTYIKRYASVADINFI